ncbi:MAG: PH domain-containing protein, partial [Propionibacteriales bacterium]|nr:PH domain-containing protein [Propionibacteriales bacterium]
STADTRETMERSPLIMEHEPAQESRPATTPPWSGSFAEPSGLVARNGPGLTPATGAVHLSTPPMAKARAYVFGTLLALFTGLIGVLLVVSGVREAGAVSVVVGALFLAMAVLSALVALVLHRAEVTIGAEEVEIVTAHRRRTVPWADVERVEMSGGVRPIPSLRLRSGQVIKVYRGELKWATYQVAGGGYRNAVMDQLLAAHESYLRRHLR